jgi:hypothetical protein
MGEKRRTNAMKVKGRIFNPQLARGNQWQEFEIEVPENLILEKLRILLLEVGYRLKWTRITKEKK